MITLFGFPIWKTKIAPESYNKQEVVNVINANYEKSRYRGNNWSEHPCLHHLYDDWDNTEFEIPNFAELSSIYTEVVNRFMSENNISGLHDGQILNYTVINDEQFMVPHMHLGVSGDTAFAAVHYLSFDPITHSPLEFKNSNILADILLSSQFSRMIDSTNTPFGYMMQSYKLQIEEDDMIIFPSCLIHTVNPSPINSSKNRICIASNIHMRPHAE